MKLSYRLLACLPLLYGAFAASAQGDWYVGAGGGVSRLTPDTDGSGFTLDESASGAFGVFGGRVFGSRYAFELGATRLGEAGLSGDESIEYSVLSGGVLGYVLGDVERVRRGEATGGFLRLGLGAIDNASDVPLEKEDNVAVWAGIGVDLPIGRIWALRAELASFDGDAQAATVSLLWRPRASSGRLVAERAPTSPVTASAPAPLPVPAPAPAPAPVPAPEVASPGSASTSASAVAADTPEIAARPAPVPAGPVAGADCPTPVAGEPVDERGCARFGGVLEGVDFAPGTATLTAGGRAELERLAVALLAEPAVTVEIRAHVAGGGDAAAGKALSRNRAIATARHLAGQGVPVARLRARAFGDERPRTDGGSDERIELGTVTP